MYQNLYAIIKESTGMHIIFGHTMLKNVSYIAKYEDPLKN